MKYYSTNNKQIKVSLGEAVVQGLAPDNGLYMPETINPLPESFFNSLRGMPLREIAFAIAKNMIGDEIPENEIRKITDHTIQFDAPLVRLGQGTYALELFHGPTMAFKDFGARFMSQLLGYFAKKQQREVVILVATSGDTGSAVANGFLGVPGTRVIVLYPSGKVSDIQEKQFTTLGQNITAIEVEGTFDDCQKMVKQAFLDEGLKNRFFLTSANSINISRLIPQSFYYFYAVSQLPDPNLPVVFSVPSGNFGNLTGGLMAKRMGLPIEAFIASTNINRIVPEYLETGIFNPKPSLQTISNAMDVGYPSNFDRMLDLFGQDQGRMAQEIFGYSFTDQETAEAMRRVYKDHKYIMDPHGAVAYLGLEQYRKQKKESVQGIFLETAHPAKFLETVEKTLSIKLPIPSTLQTFVKREKKSIPVRNSWDDFSELLIQIIEKGRG